MKSILKIFVIAVLAVQFTSCSNDDLGPSIFDTSSKVLDPDLSTYKFDKFLYDSYLKPYNLEFMYKLKDVEADMSYNLVPASLANSEKLAVLAKYLWFDVYSEVVDSTFLKQYGPRMIALVGSPAYNPATGTMILGLAEGGIKISLFKVNSIETDNPDMLNEYYFKTMHHEFAHILHQTKQYPKEYNLISFKYYDPYNWQNRSSEEAASLGFASPYGSSATREDFVEIIANYIVKTDDQWNTLLDYSSKGWVVDEYGNVKENNIVLKNINGADSIVNVDTDGVNGKEVIMRKLGICRTWLKDSWGINLDLLRSTVQYRQSHIDMDSLLLQIR